jgi:hypothetical protein
MKRGVSSTTAILAGAMSAHSVQAASASLAQSVTVVAAGKGAAAGGSTLTLIKGTLKLMAWTKAKTAIVAGIVVILAAGTTIVTVKQIQYQQRNRGIATALLEMHHQWAANDYHAEGRTVPKILAGEPSQACSAGPWGAYVLYDYQKNGIAWSRIYQLYRENTNTTIWTLYEFAAPKDTNLVKMAWRKKLTTVIGEP